MNRDQLTNMNIAKSKKTPTVPGTTTTEQAVMYPVMPAADIDVDKVGLGGGIPSVGGKVGAYKEKNMWNVPDATYKLKELDTLYDTMSSLLSKITGVSLDGMPTLSKPESSSYNELMERGPQRMDSPGLPGHIEKAMLSSTIAGVVGDLMQSIVSGITGEAVVTPPPSVAAMEQTSDMILADLASHQESLEKIDMINMELEREYNRDVLTALDRYDERLDRYEQTQIANFINKKTFEMNNIRSMFDMNHIALKEMADIKMKEIDADYAQQVNRQNVAMQESRNAQDIEGRYVARLQTRDQINAEIAFKNASLQISYFSALQKSKDLRKTSLPTNEYIRDRATTAQVFGSDSMVSSAARGDNYVSSLNLTPNMLELVTKDVAGSDREARNIWNAFYNPEVKGSDTVALKKVKAYYEADNMLADAGFFLDDKTKSILADHIIKMNDRTSVMQSAIVDGALKVTTSPTLDKKLRAAGMKQLPANTNSQIYRDVRAKQNLDSMHNFYSSQILPVSETATSLQLKETY